jgi:hypothetical protein
LMDEASSAQADMAECDDDTHDCVERYGTAHDALTDYIARLEAVAEAARKHVHIIGRVYAQCDICDALAALDAGDAP